MTSARAEVVTVGTELLLGEIVDTNAAYLARVLADLGINLFYKTTVGDNWFRLTAALAIALSRSDVIIISGGLGPTQDDITKEVVAATLGEPLTLRPESFEQIERYLSSMGRTVSENNRRQALLPKSAEPIPNPVGTAPGVWLEYGDKLIVCLPGVPHELKSIMEQTVIPRLRERVHVAPLHSRVLRFSGIGESALEEALIDLIKEQSSPTLALYASVGEVRLRMTCRAKTAEEAADMFAPVEAEIRKRLASYLYATGDASLEEMIGDVLSRQGETLAVAESCTGGLVGHRITSIPGSSGYFLGGIVAYDNAVKSAALTVSEELLEKCGAVSEDVALAMADGVRQRLGSTYGIGVTGIAGPTGGSDVKPVGTVYIACSSDRGQRTIHRLFRGQRDVIKTRAAQEALWLLYQTLLPSSNGER